MEVTLRIEATLGEGPRWDAAQSSLWTWRAEHAKPYLERAAKSLAELVAYASLHRIAIGIACLTLSLLLAAQGLGVIPSPTDATLKGDITGISIRPTAFDGNQQASRYEITVIVKVEFRDVVNDKVLYENPAQTFKEEYEVTTAQSADAQSFLGQNSNALERLATDFAKTVVTAVLEAF